MGYQGEERNDYMRQYRKRRREAAIRSLGGECVECGSTNSLQFDHIDPSQKEFPVGTWCVSKEREQTELAKCQLLCYECHLRKTSVDLSAMKRQEIRHGLSGYINKRCRCDECKCAYSAYRKKRRAEGKEWKKK